MSTSVHEASHAVAAIMLGRPVEHLWRETGHALAGDEVGHCRAPILDEVQCRELVVSLIGYLSENKPGWPPTYADACEEPLEALATLIRVLHIDECVYEELVEVAREMLRDPDFIRPRDAIARALTAVPRLEREDIEALCLIAGTQIPQVKESSPCPS
jgi:hypothetical protein